MAETKVSSKSMEAAMVARLFKDAMESADPIVAHFVWQKDDGQQLDLGLPRPHPSFPNKAAALSRLEERIGQWVSGEKPAVDRNAIARIEIEGGVPLAFDFSMESFEKAALADDGTLVVAVGHSKGVGREPMELGRVTRLKLLTREGTVIGRRQALVPIKEIIQIQKRERESAAKRLAAQERDVDESLDANRALFQEESRQWEDDMIEPVHLPAVQSPLTAPKTQEPRPAGKLREPVKGFGPHSVTDPEQAKNLMDAAINAVGSHMGSVLKGAPLPVVEAIINAPPLARAPRAKENEERIPVPVGVAATSTSEPGTHQQHQEVVEATHGTHQVAVSLAPARAGTDASPGAASQTRVEKPSPKVDPGFLRAVFPVLPEGVDEVHVTISKERLFEAIVALEDLGSFEMRLASKGDGQLNIGVCVPCGNVALLSDFVSHFAQGGVMIKRAQSKP